MLATQELQGRLLDQEDRQAYNARLLSALGDGRQWEYRGECNDLRKPVGKCSCGHQIRFEYIIHHRTDQDRTAVVGSDCVGYFAQVTPETFAALSEAVEATKARLAEAKRAAEEAKRQEAAQAEEAAWRELRERALALDARGKELGKRVPGALWRAVHRSDACAEEAPEYQRTCDLVKWYKRQAEVLRQALSDCGNPASWERQPERSYSGGYGYGGGYGRRW
jgi:hypothetical protein